MDILLLGEILEHVLEEVVVYPLLLLVVAELLLE